MGDDTNQLGMQVQMKRACATTLVILALLATQSPAFSLRELPQPVRDEHREAEAGRIALDRLSEGAAGHPESFSPSRAVFYSLLLPGLGQYYLGEKSAAWKFFMAEGAIWASFIVFQIQGHLRRDAYKDYALLFAGITTREHSDDFFREIGDYDSAYEYEIALKMEGRARTYPYSDYATLERYFVENRVSDYEPWSWRSRADREHYYSLRWGSRLALRRSLYSLAAALGNRVLSSVLALRSARGGGSGESAAQLGFYTSTEPAGHATLGFSIRREF